MAIVNDDSINSQLFSKVFTVSAGPPETFTQQLSQINSQLLDSKIELTVVASGLDADVQLSQFQGNTGTFSDMGAILDTQTELPIQDIITNESRPIISTTRFFYLGLELDPLTATTGTVTVTGRA
jgi:hypothetical protein